MKRIIFLLLLIMVFAITQGVFAQILTQKEKADIQYQLNSIASVANDNAYEIKYGEDAGAIRDAWIKDSYKEVYKKFEGEIAPSDNVELLHYIEYGNETDSAVEVIVNLNTEYNHYEVTSKYNFDTRKFEDAEKIFLYMCIAKHEGWEAPEIINLADTTELDTTGQLIEESQPVITETQQIENQDNISVKAESGSTEKTSENKILGYIFWSIFGFCLICYIIALIRTRQGKMVTIVNWYDFTLLVVPLILWILAYLINSDFQIFSKILCIIGGLCLIGSMVWSIIANKGSVFNMIVSIFAKLFVASITWLIIFYIFRPRKTHETVADGTGYTRKLSLYEQEIEDKKHRRNSLIAISILGFLILSLINSINGKEVIEKLKEKYNNKNI